MGGNGGATMKSDIGTGCEGCWHGLCVDRGIKSRDKNLPLCHSKHPMPADKRGVSLPAMRARLSVLEERAAACGACKGTGRDRSRGGVIYFRIGQVSTPDGECLTCLTVRQEIIDVRREVVKLQQA